MQGDFLIAQSFDFISKTGSIDLIKYYSQCNLNVIKGELYQNKKKRTNSQLGRLLQHKQIEKLDLYLPAPLPFPFF